MSLSSSMGSPIAPAPINKTNLIVNYLPQSFTDSDFKDLFSCAGNVTAFKIIRDRQTGYSYGFGFIDYETEEEAEMAIQILNGHQLQHKRIKVSYARQGDNVKGANLYLRNLPKHLTEADLEQMFGAYGHIVQARVLLDANNESRGVGFVLYSTREQAQSAMSTLDGTTPMGFSQPISIKFAEDNRLKMRPNPLAPISPTNIPLGYLQQQQQQQHIQMPGYNNGMFSPGGGPMRNGQVRARFNPMLAGMMAPPQAHAIGPVIPAATELGFVLFVFNIGSETDEFELWKLFSPFGVVQKVNVVRDHEKKTGKGYGFVTMANYSEAVGAIHGLNGHDFYGNKLQVSFKN